MKCHVRAGQTIYSVMLIVALIAMAIAVSFPSIEYGQYHGATTQNVTAKRPRPVVPADQPAPAPESSEDESEG